MGLVKSRAQGLGLDWFVFLPFFFSSATLSLTICKLHIYMKNLYFLGLHRLTKQGS